MIFTLQAEPRNTVRKSDNKALRAAGRIPAVVYGTDLPSIKLSLSAAEFQKCYKQSFTELAFYELILEGKKYHSILKERQIHPVTRNFLHLDFMVVSADSTIELDIPLNIVGESLGEKEGGFMDVVQRTIKVIGKAADLPEGFELDVSEMHVGDTKHIRDLPTGNWTYKDADDITLVVIHGKVAAVEEPAEDEIEAVEGEAAAEAPAEE